MASNILINNKRSESDPLSTMDITRITVGLKGASLTMEGNFTAADAELVLKGFFFALAAPDEQQAEQIKALQTILATAHANNQQLRTAVQASTPAEPSPADQPDPSIQE